MSIVYCIAFTALFLIFSAVQRPLGLLLSWVRVTESLRSLL